MINSRFLVLVSAVLALSWLSGCSTTAPAYAVSIPNVQSLKSATLSNVSVGTFAAQGADAHNESIGIRAMSMGAANGTFSAYLQDAVVQELSEARLFDPASNVKITAVLLKNDISAAGIVTASAEIEARFTVTDNGQIIFDKSKRAHIEWDSHFVGSVAISRAVANYPPLVTALLKELYADKDFLAALKAKARTAA